MSEADASIVLSAEALLASKLEEFCRSQSLSEEGLQEIIAEQNRLTPMPNYYFFGWACYNKRVNERIIHCLIENFPAALSSPDEEDEWLPIHFACRSPCATLKIIELLIDAAPDSLRSVTDEGHMPLHMLCDNKQLEDEISVKILKLLIEKHPAAVRHADDDDDLPIHIAAKASKSPEFCSLLIEAYPGSERIAASMGIMPLHLACARGPVATVDYLYKLYPDAINHEAEEGYPMHYTMNGLSLRKKIEDALEIVQYLLDCHPNVVMQQYERRSSLLSCACDNYYADSNIEAAMQIIKTIYDAHPEAIEDDRIASEMRHYHEQVQSFISTQLGYARQAKDHRLMTTPDMNGQLPLHRALENNGTLGSIKLLIRGNPSSLRVPDNNFAMPLHIACENHDFASVVQCLLGLDMRTLDAVDRQSNTALHYACRGAKYETIEMMLEKYGAISVSKRNVQKKLPIDLLWESNRVSDRESLEYIGSVFKLLRANPEMMFMTSSMTTKQPADADATRNRKKRKCGQGHEE